jgi:hypothetical protein
LEHQNKEMKPEIRGDMMDYAEAKPEAMTAL